MIMDEKPRMSHDGQPRLEPLDQLILFHFFWSAFKKSGRTIRRNFFLIQDKTEIEKFYFLSNKIDFKKVKNRLNFLKHPYCSTEKVLFRIVLSRL